MSRYNIVPRHVQQMVETLENVRVSQNEKFNVAHVLEVTKEYCEQALVTFKKEQDKKRR